MDYKKIYDALVEKAKVRGLDKSKHEGYFEIHHIIPVCLGGSDEDDNLVMFTAREHYIAHMLLWRAYPQDRSLASAAFFMRNTRTERNKFNSKLYAKLSEDYSKLMSERMSGEQSPHYKDLTGLENNKLRVLEFSHWKDTNAGTRISMWLVECSCGNLTTIAGHSFTSGATKSCGCLRAESIRKYNFSKKVRKAYYPLKRKYLSTGELCDRWADEEFGIYFFAEDVGEPVDQSLKIGRLDNTKPYSKENCAWMTTREISMRNRRTSANKSGRTGVRKILAHNGQYEYWKAEITVNGELLDLGTRKVFEEAVKLREEAELIYFGFIKE